MFKYLIPLLMLANCALAQPLTTKPSFKDMLIANCTATQLLIGGTTSPGCGAAFGSTNTPSTMVLRDGSGNFAAGTITATLSGNASTATSAASLSSNLPVSNLNSGTGASATTFWAGDANWKAPFILTTTGTSGAATFSSGTLNIPQYTGGGGGGVSSVTVNPGTGITVSGTCTITSSGTCTVTNSGIVSVSRQVFTASGTYTPSSGTLYAFVECWGGGGGGGGITGISGQSLGSGGGGAGSYSSVLVNAATIGASKTVTIGTGGNGGAAGNNNGSAGGDTSVGTFCIGKGGGGGTTVGANAIGAGGIGGVGGTGDTVGIGQVGGTVLQVAASAQIVAFGGVGGGTSIGSGGQSAASSGSAAAGFAGTLGGGGAGASAGSTTATAAGGNGGAGYVRITEYKSQ